MYGVVFSFKDPFDTKDMRSTGGGDAAYDIDVPARDHVLVEQLREQGRHHLRQGREHRVQRPRRQSRRTARAAPRCCRRRSAISAAAGAAIRRIPTTPRARPRSDRARAPASRSAPTSSWPAWARRRAPRRRGPANHNAVALILPHKAMLGFVGGAIGADIYCDRTGILCRTIADCAKVLDALKDPVDGYYDPRDPFTTVPRSSVLPRPTRPTRRAGHARRARGHAHRRDPRVHGVPARLDDGGADRHRRRAGDQGRARRHAGRDAGRIDRSPLDARSGHRGHDGRLPARARPARAALHARPAVPAGPGRPAGLQGVRGRHRADRVRARPGVRQRAR